MCGLKRRSEYPDFTEFVNNYDLMCFSGAKIDAADIISFPGYCCYDQPRKQTYSRKSGGISVYFKENVSKHISKIETESDYVLWIELSKELFKLDENIQMESEITSFCSSHKYVLLSGDFNASNAELRDLYRM